MLFEEMNPSDRIYVSGHNGMVGSAICRKLLKYGFGNPKLGGCLLTANKKELNLKNTIEVEDWFSKNKPEIVISAAARVGGIQAHRNFPADFLLENLKIQNNLIENSYKVGVKRFLFIASSCIYPFNSNELTNENSLLDSKIDFDNQWYGIAKIAGIKACDAMKIQYDFDAISVVPTNLYGPGDHFHPEKSHVIASLIRKFVLAMKDNHEIVTCWGSGESTREFLHVDDLAEACIFLLNKWFPKKEELNYINVGSGIDTKIKELANLIKIESGFKGRIEWDLNMPEGKSRRAFDLKKIREMGWEHKIPLKDGLIESIKFFKKNYL